mmetsp:Transcript_75546/g.208445  ORF Transcript_75546/g.208445 Transcript_75546/m.208445 type:complete len:90 (-) Transcript_75546:8-277(-)
MRPALARQLCPCVGPGCQHGLLQQACLVAAFAGARLQFPVSRQLVLSEACTHEHPHDERCREAAVCAENSSTRHCCVKMERYLRRGTEW